MNALINFKICDNAMECGGIEVCPTGAMYFDEEKNTIVVDEKKCTNCGLCEKECPIGAIMVAKDKKQYLQYVQDIDNDQRTIKDLFVDRYGAVSLSEFFLITNKDIKKKIVKSKLTFIEIFDSETANCLLKSIPIKEITDNIKEEVYYYKLDKNDEVCKQYKIKEYPSLLIFKQNELLGRVNGYYTVDEKAEFNQKIDQILRTN